MSLISQERKERMESSEEERRNSVRIESNEEECGSDSACKSAKYSNFDIYRTTCDLDYEIED